MRCGQYPVRLVRLAVLLFICVGAAPTSATQHDVVQDWSYSSNPNGTIFYAHGDFLSPLNHPDAIQYLPPLADGSGFGYPGGGVTVRLPDPSQPYLTVGAAWWDIVMVGFQAPERGTVTLSATLFNIGTSDIHYWVMVRTGAREVYPQFPGIWEYSLVGTDLLHPTSFVFTEATPLEKGDVAYLAFYPENCCGDILGLKLAVQFVPSLVAVPEPGPVGMLGLGALVLGWRARKRL